MSGVRQLSATETAVLHEIVDRLDRIEHRIAAADRSNVAERWVDKKRLAAALGMSTRWVEDRVADGMPHREIGRNVRFRISDVERWLVRRGMLRDR